jgi:hypothetical protein
MDAARSLFCFLLYSHADIDHALKYSNMSVLNIKEETVKAPGQGCSLIVCREPEW